MTGEMMNPRALVEKAPDADILREMMGFVVQRLIELELERLTGTAHCERSPDQIIQRSSDRDRAWETGCRARAMTNPRILETHADGCVMS
jgi:putative transposase